METNQNVTTVETTSPAVQEQPSGESAAQQAGLIPRNPTEDIDAPKFNYKSKKVLTDNLRALESDGLIEREVFAEVPPRVVYSLSDLGKTLKPILDAMFDWGTDYKNSLE